MLIIAQVLADAILAHLKLAQQAKDAQALKYAAMTGNGAVAPITQMTTVQLFALTHSVHAIRLHQSVNMDSGILIQTAPENAIARVTALSLLLNILTQSHSAMAPNQRLE